MITKYMTSKYRASSIVAIECTRETAKCVFRPSVTGHKEYRQAKDGDWDTFHDTWEEARAHLLTRVETAIDRLQKSLATAEAERIALLAMANPESAA